MIKNVLVLLFAFFFYGCLHAQTVPNPEAIKLNDKAMQINMNFSSGTRAKDLHHAIRLLDQAILIDSNFFIPRWNKLSFQTELKQLDSAVITGKRILKKWPKNTLVITFVGEYCDQKGDSVAAAKYYRNALSVINHDLDSLAVSSRHYNNRLLEKAKLLILLNQPERAQAILQDMYKTETDPYQKEVFKDFMGMTRLDILNGKTTISKGVTKEINW